jgi:hypothetical protein
MTFRISGRWHSGDPDHPPEFRGKVRLLQGFNRMGSTLFLTLQLLLIREKSPCLAFSFKPDRKVATSGGITKRHRISGDAGIILLKRTSCRAKGY